MSKLTPPAAAFEILVETHDLDLDRLPYNALAATATNLSVSLTCNSPIVVYIFYKCSTVKEKRCVNCFDHCFAHLENSHRGVAAGGQLRGNSLVAAAVIAVSNNNQWSVGS